MQVYLLATKVSLHPLAKLFQLFERSFVLCSTFVESFKAIFYYTSCQPNWSLVVPDFIVNESVTVFFYPRKTTITGEAKSETWQDSNIRISSKWNNNSFPWTKEASKTKYVTDYDNISFFQPWNCGVIGGFSSFCNTGALVFFAMTCFLRFYLIVIKKGQPQQETRNSGLKSAGFVLLGISVQILLYTMTLSEHFAFSRTCLAPHSAFPPLGKVAQIYYLVVLVIDLVIVFVLYIIIILKVTKSQVGSLHSASELQQVKSC